MTLILGKYKSGLILSTLFSGLPHLFLVVVISGGHQLLINITAINHC